MYELKNYHFEIILVDSASTDNTIKIAKKYPIKIIQLNQNKYLSPSAGRYIGTKESTGEFIFFMDSDAIIIGGFVKKALKYFKKNVAGVRGVLYRVYPGEILNKKHKERVRFGNHDPLWGQAAIYRKSALDLCGTFNPFVRGEEER
jgi:glycosyltransferase involved in cell wall biosynthesis